MSVPRAGGHVYSDWEVRNARITGKTVNGRRISTGKPWASKWLVDQFGVDFFGRSVRIRIGGPSTTDAELEATGRLDRLGLTGLTFLDLPEVGVRGPF